MSIVAWIVFGVLAGFIASRIVNRRGAGVLADMLLGIVGAVVGGLIFNLVGAVGITGFNVWSLFVAVLGAALVLVTVHGLAGGRAP
jgi:uncharacterized membrane protein YeaQ/YmgE (transglycosylase-associated protein family)